MEEKEMEFDLEDILREFGSGDSREPENDGTTEETPAEETPQPQEEPVEQSPEPEETGEADADGESPEEEENFNSEFWQSIRTSPLLPEDEEMQKQLLEEEPQEDEDLRIYMENPDYKEPPKVALTDETRRFTAIPEAAAENAPTGDTIRLDSGAVSAAVLEKEKQATSDTVIFTPVNPEAESEPFSKDWEPRYEQPMGEYVPPEPIVFRPRSRLSELKKKLVAGPERRYYALAEMGLGKLQISIFLSILVVILSVAAICLYRMDLVQEGRMRLLVFSEVFAMLLAALLGNSRMIEGIASLFKGRFTLDTLMTVTFLVCMVDGWFCLQEVRVPFCAAFCLEVVMSQWAEFQRRNSEMGMMDTMRKAVRLNRVAKAPDCYEGRAGFYVEDGEVEDFMDSYNAVSGPEKAMNVYALLAFLLSAAIGVFAGWMEQSVSTGFRIGSAAILAAAPATAFLCNSRPLAVLERRMHKLGVVICGWSGVKAAGGKNVVPVSDEDLLPGGSVKVNGVKFYSTRNTDETVAYATAVIEASGMSIAGLFTQLLDSRYGRHYDVENFRFYENGGIGGDVCGEPVLVGSLSFLQEMGVDLPEGARVAQAVYVAVDGELCGVFAMAFGKLRGVSAALHTLCGHRNAAPVVLTENFLLSESFIRAKYNVNTKRMLFPNLHQRNELRLWQPDPEKRSICALTTQDGLTGAAFAITGARTLGSTMWAGTWMHIFGGVAGMAIVFALSLVDGGAALLSPANLLLLELIWAVPGLLITEWTRRL